MKISYDELIIIDRINSRNLGSFATQDADLESQLAHVVASLTGTLAGQGLAQTAGPCSKRPKPRTSRRGNFGASAATGRITKSCCCEGYLEFHYEDIYEDI